MRARRRTTPRWEHGYCTDDNARLLVVASREPDDGAPAHLGRLAFDFCRSALSAGPDGDTTSGVDVEMTDVSLAPDPRRVVLRFFVPGREDVGPGDSRAGSVIDRVLDLTEAEVRAELFDVHARFAGRHRQLLASFDLHAAGIAQRLDDPGSLSAERRRLLGAVFSHEYAFEGAALCNPSIVAHPHQPGDGSTAIVVSVRGIGEGHRSSIGFRTGTVDIAGGVTIDETAGFAQIGSIRSGTHRRSVLHRKLAELHDDHENAAFVLDPLPETFGATEQPILRPEPGGRDGYVPNVVYTCGALAVGDLLVLPFGIGDQRIAVATLSIAGLIGSMTRIA